MHKRHCEPCTVESIHIANFRSGTTDDADTVLVSLDFGGGSGQDFGGLYLPHTEMQMKFVDMLSEIFLPDKVENSEAFALRNFTHWNAPIVGLQSKKTNKTFLIRDFLKSIGVQPKDPLLERRESLSLSIESSKETISRCEEQIKNLRSDFYEW